MINKRLVQGTLLLLTFVSLALFSPKAALAIDCSTTTPTTTQEAIQCGADGSAGVPDAGTPEKNLDNTISNVINLLSAVIGVIAVIVIIVGGLRYVTSGGKQESVTGAKNTIQYAIIGLVVVALAQIVVHFVLSKTNDSTTTKSTPATKTTTTTPPDTSAQTKKNE